MITDAHPPSDCLVLDRFCGRELYPIVRTTWNLYHDDTVNLENLCISVEGAEGTQLHDDTQKLNARPCWEINVVERNLTSEKLRAGVVFTYQSGYDAAKGGHITNIYYCEHEVTDYNRIEILGVDGIRLHLRLTGQTVDVNYYDGSKAPTNLYVDAWFIRDDQTNRSIQ